ncbi:MAG: hypothetical protein U0804_01400 [Gemmataceae bacterium]
MHNAAHIPEALWSDLRKLCTGHNVEWLARTAGLGKSTVYDALVDREKRFHPWVQAHLRWTVTNHWRGENLPANCKGESESCPACARAGAKDYVVVRLPAVIRGGDDKQEFRSELLRAADEFRGRWQIEEALSLTHLAYDLERERDLSFEAAVQQVEIAAKVGELSRRTGEERRCSEAYTSYIVPSLRRLADSARRSGKRIPVPASVRVVKELVALENEGYGPVVPGSLWVSRFEWLRSAVVAFEPELIRHDEAEFHSVQRQLFLGSIRFGRLDPSHSRSMRDERTRVGRPLHYYGMKNLASIALFDRQNPRGVVNALLKDYRLLRRRMFAAPDRYPSPVEAERSTMQGMALYLGVALWQSRKSRATDPDLDQCLVDSRRIHDLSGGRARCIVSPAILEAARGWEQASGYLSTLTSTPRVAALASRGDEAWELARDLLPGVSG